MTEGLIMSLLLSCLDYGRGTIGVTTRTLKLDEHWFSAVPMSPMPAQNFTSLGEIFLGRYPARR